MLFALLALTHCSAAFGAFASHKRVFGEESAFRIIPTPIKRPAPAKSLEHLAATLWTGEL